MTPLSTSGLATCLSCHTAHPSLTYEAVQAGDHWQCVRCGQDWDAGRLATVAAYIDWVAERLISKGAA
jgi:predicted CXXCH cytochrome family protein